MGNRAVITLAPFGLDNMGIYVHWNGGPESIAGFLQAAKALGMRPPKSDPSYAMARLTQVIANYFGGSTSVGIGKVRDLDYDNGDNGTYLIGGDWEIVGREFFGENFAVDQEKTRKIAAQAIEKTRLFAREE
jgi:hypothetical protein